MSYYQIKPHDVIVSDGFDICNVGSYRNIDNCIADIMTLNRWKFHNHYHVK